MSAIEMFNESFQNWKRYLSCKAQLIISDPPYNLAENMYASNPMWYEGGDNRNGESKFAKKAAFDTDFDSRPAEWMHFCSRLLVKEPKEKGKSPCMIIFCGFEQQMQYIELGRRYGFNHYINLVFRKNYSPQVLKANMKIVGNCEYGLVLYRDKLPKFNNEGHMIFNHLTTINMILTAAFIISKAIGTTWSWWYIILAILADYEFQNNLKNINKK